MMLMSAAAAADDDDVNAAAAAGGVAADADVADDDAVRCINWKTALTIWNLQAVGLQLPPLHLIEQHVSEN